jgi:predicted secreted hydrolase
MHAAVTDLQTGKRYASQTRTGGVPAQTVANGFDFSQGRWRVAAAGPSHTLRTASDDMAISLDLKDAGPVVAHRAAGSKTPGLLDFGKAGISYYYSRPRIAAKGDIVVGGKTVSVSGPVWFDHQWGEFDASALGWNWFALHLANGSDVMVYQLFDAEGRKVMTAGTVSDAKGAAPLKSEDIELTPGARWTSPLTQIPYIVEWRLRLPSGVYDVKPFYPCTATRWKLLRAAVFDWLRANPLGPLEEEIILVQSNGVAEWLKIALAEELGVCAATRVALPARFLWEAYRGMLGPRAGAEAARRSTRTR